MAIVQNVGCGMRWTRTCQLTSDGARTAKSCGPDASKPAPSCAKEVSRSDGGNKADHRGEHEASRNTIAQGMSDDATYLWRLTRVLSSLHARLRVQRAPGIPCALFIGGIFQGSGAKWAARRFHHART